MSGVFFFFASHVAYGDVLTEEKVLELFRSQSTLQMRTKSAKSQSELTASLVKEMYQPRLETSINYRKTDELGGSFQPFLSPSTELSLGVVKKTSLGMALDAKIFGDQSSLQNGSIKDETRVGARLGLQVDLWKNIFGRLDRATLASAEATRKRLEIQNSITEKSQENLLRKIYWSLVSVEESIALSKELLKSAEKQAADAEQRLRAGISDRGEVAKYKSQTESRRGSLLLYQNERELLLQEFEKVFTGFQSSQWKVTLANRVQKESEIEKCLVKIKSQPEADRQATFFDESVELLKQEQEAELVLAKKHSDVDVSLIGQVQTSGLGTGASAAQDNFRKDRKSGYGVGLQVSIPIGSVQSNSEKYLIAVKENLLSAEAAELENQLKSTHNTIVKSISLLYQGISAQQANSNSLKVSVEEMQKKYRQGRIPISAVTLEQDSYFQSKLQEITLKKQIAHTMLDYFSVFTEFNCQWNLISKGAK